MKHAVPWLKGPYLSCKLTKSHACSIAMMSGLNCRSHESFHENIRYKFVQLWPKEGAYFKSEASPLESRKTIKQVFSHPKRCKCVNHGDRYGVNKESLRKLDTWRESKCENSYWPSFGQYSSQGNGFSTINYNRKLSQTKPLTTSSQHQSEDGEVEVYVLPPMLLPAIRKSKSFDFKAMKANASPHPPVDPFFYSSQSRRRRALAQKLEAENYNIMKYSGISGRKEM